MLLKTFMTRNKKTANDIAKQFNVAEARNVYNWSLKGAQVTGRPGARVITYTKELAREE